MAGRFGDANPSNYRFGDAQPSKLYIGDSLFWTAGPGAVNIDPTGIVPGEAFGSATMVPGPVGVTTTGIASEEAFGTAMVAPTQYLAPTGIVPAEAFGTSTIGRGPVTVTATGIVPGEAFGSSTVGSTYPITGVGNIASGEAFGTTKVGVQQYITPSGIGSGEAFGTAEVVAGVQHLTGVTYSQSNVYFSNNAATYQYMNNGNADGSANNNQTGMSGVGGYIRADCGSTKYIDRIVLGYDYLDNLPGGWGVTYTENQSVQASTNGSTWTTITTTPTYESTGSDDGLVSIVINGNWRYIQIVDTQGYLCTLEFEVWGS